MLAFAAVITREGNISGLEALGDNRGRLQVAQLINEISRGRLEPARYGADPIAVNMVWLVEHMTVKPAAGGRCARTAVRGSSVNDARPAHLMSAERHRPPSRRCSWRRSRG